MATLVVFSLLSLPSFADTEGTMLSLRNLNSDGAVSVLRFEANSPEEAVQLFKDFKPNVLGVEQAGIVVTTDNPKVIEQVAEASIAGEALGGSKIKPKFLLTGLTKIGSNIRTGFNDRIQNDKLGVTIVVINTAVECFMWFTTESISRGTAWALSAVTVAIAVTLGFDKDMWYRLTDPSKRTIKGLFDKLSKVDSAKFNAFKAITSEYIANVALTIPFQAFRMGVMSLDSFVERITSGSFWSVTALSATLITFATFSWGQQLKDIDKTTNPVAKNILRRFSELRSVFLTYTSPSSKITNPEIYGYESWVALFATGSIGIFSRIFTDPIKNWIESNRIMNRTHLAIEKLESLFSFKKSNTVCGMLWVAE